MAGPSVHADVPASGAHLVLYDGICGLCHRIVQFVLAHDKRGAFVFAALQSDAGRQVVTRLGGAASDTAFSGLASFYVVAHFRTNDARLLARSRAVLFVIEELGWPWRAAAWLRVLPRSFLDRGYDLVARHRYRVFGRFDTCPAPRVEDRGRFLDT